jgi:integrase/recombinase XerD
MGSIKAVLRQKENKDGTFPLAIRITKDRKSSYIYIGQHLDKKYWDPLKRHVKKSHPNSARLNNLIAKKIAETNNKLLEIETEKGEASAISVRKV